MSNASDAAELNMEEAVAKVNDARAHVNMAPSSIEQLQGVVNTSVAVVANIERLTTTWGPLLCSTLILSSMPCTRLNSGKVD